MAISLLVDKKNELKYKDLVGVVKKGKAFSTQKSVHLVAAVIALKLKFEPKKVSNRHEIIRYTNLSSKEQKVMKYIALSCAKDPFVLADQEKIVDIVNGLANAGFPTLYEAIYQSGGDHIYKLIEYCQKHFWRNK